MLTQKSVIGHLKELAAEIKQSGLHLKKVVLYGSYSRNEQHKWSDIDVAFVADEFIGIGFEDVKFFVRPLSRRPGLPIQPSGLWKDNYFQMKKQTFSINSQSIFLFLVLTLVSFFASGQDKISSQNNEEWLKTITGNAIGKAAKAGTFLKAHPGYALYFSQAGAINEPYLVYVPGYYDPAHARPAVVFLHGAILARDSFQYKSPEIADEPIFSVADAFNTIVIFPFARQDFKWSGKSPAFENIINIIKQVELDYNVDHKRIYIGGISMGGNATYWFINNKPEMFAGFYTVSALPGAGGAAVNFSNITMQKPLYSINAKDDPVFPYSDVEAVYGLHKNETPGWHFSTVESGGHRFIYSKGGEKYVKSLLANLLQPEYK